MPLLRREPKRDLKQRPNCNEKAAESLTEQLNSLKNTFSQVLSSICKAIEKNCGDIGDSEKAYELARIKEEYTNLKEEVCRIISVFNLASPVTKEDTQAVQEGLNQCMTYLNRVHYSMESILKKYKEDESSRCCSEAAPHIHKIIDGNHVIVQLNKGTRSEMDYVSRLLNNVNTLPENKRKKLIKRMCNIPDSEEELGAGDSRAPGAHMAAPRCRNYCNSDKSVVPLRNDSSNSENHPLHSSTVQEQVTVQPRLCENRYFPEKIIESLLIGYNCIDEVNSEDKKPELKVKIEEKEPVPESSPIVQSLTDANNVKLDQGKVDSVLHIFDSQGNPLTDSKGVPLKNIRGELLVKFHDMKPVSSITGGPIFDSNCLPIVTDLEKPLHDVNGKPLRLFNQEGIPLTDENGYPLRLANGEFSLNVDVQCRLVSDACRRPLYDSNGRQITPHLTGCGCRQQSCMKKPSLHNLNRSQLFKTNPKPASVTHGNTSIMKDHAPGVIMDLPGLDVGSKNELNNSSFVRKTISLFDGNKYPLTSCDGAVLRNVEGKEMVLFENSGKAMKDCFDRLVYDARGYPSNNEEFNPFTAIQRKLKVKNMIKIGEQVYDFRGYPLIDADGSSLVTSDGKMLVVCDDKGEIVHDLNGLPVYDKAGVPFCKLNGCWITPQGDPYRVYDREGFPLTSEIGEELHDIKGISLVSSDRFGRPVKTASGDVVHDVKGAPATSSDFDPTQRPSNGEFTRKVYIHNKPMKVYNSKGLPLTDITGIAMLDSKGKDLIQFDEHGIPIKDVFGGRIYDEYSVPLNCKKDHAIISMNGKPYRIYDKMGRPLTDIHGTPLNLANGMCTIKFDNAGRPVSDFRNFDLYDVTGRSLHDSKADAERAESILEKGQIKLVKKDGKPVKFYNREGMPLTDRNGSILVNSDGTHLKADLNNHLITDWNGDPVYSELGQPITRISDIDGISVLETGESNRDPFGRPLKDACGEHQFDKYGRPLYDLYRRSLYDYEGRPIANAYGRYLSNNQPEPKEVDVGFDPGILAAGSVAGVESLTDLIGGPLFDYSGLPLYNQFGKPLIDIYGRSLYDESGQPLCDETGKPVSELVRQNGTAVDVQDIYKPIEVSKEIAALIDNNVVRSRRTEIIPNIPGIWILPTSPDGTAKASGSDNLEKRIYLALLRITTFHDGRKSFEILEAKPYLAD